MDFSAYYKKANIINLVTGAYFVLAALFTKVTEPHFWISIIAVIVLPRFFLGLSKPEKVELREARRRILQKRPGLAYQMLFLGWGLGLAAGFAAYKYLSFSYERSAFVFIGVATLLGIVNNRRIQALHQADIGSVFE